MALVYPDGREVLAEGYMNGRIIDQPRGDKGFGYDPLFMAEGESRTVAEMSEGEKNAISHRANALKNLLTKI
jgi:XTP/dITP diphosphohydrolase